MTTQPKMKAILDWAKAEGREKDISPGLQALAGSDQLTDEEVQERVKKMEEARKVRNFKLADSIRADTIAAGILIENTKEGVRWRRK